jgi:glutaredoxin
MTKRMVARARWVLVTLLALSFVLVVAACKKPVPTEQASLPIVTDDAKGLSFAYLNEKGDYRAVDTIAEVPNDARAFVRVYDTSRDPPEGSVFIADLTHKNGDGTYTVRVAPRDELDTRALERRKAVGPTIAMNGQSAPLGGDAGAQGGAASSAGPNGAAAMAPQVVIYGAEWCGACHQAAEYLTKRGIRFVEKDIEKDAGAEREMRAKLAKAGLPGGGIPVIDIGGNVMVGFLPSKVEMALKSLGEPI